MEEDADAAGGTAAAAPSAPASKLARRIKFRLDDGSLIADASLVNVASSQPVVCLRPSDAVDRQLAGERELARLQRLLSSSELPQVTGVEQALAPPSKKPRLESRPSVSVGAAALDWRPKCREILQKLRQHLDSDPKNSNSAIFEHAVDAKLVPDYYTIIKQPMWFSKVEEKLRGDEYTAPNEFFDDMRQIWSNCFIYNKKGEWVHGAGVRGERKFEELWLNSGLSSERSKRATAGLAAQRFEPELELGKPAAAKPGPPSKGNVPGKKPTQSGAARYANGSGRAYSHEVTSGGKGREKALSSERRQQIANDLQNALGDGSLSEEQLEALMALLPAEATTTDENGEMELDFECLDDANLRKLDVWLRSTRGQAPQMSPSHISHNPSVRLEAGDMDDEDYHSD